MMEEAYANESLNEVARQIALQKGPEPHWDTLFLMRVIRHLYFLLNPRDRA